MTEWARVAGGRYNFGSWKVGIAGVDLHSGDFFFYTDEGWSKLVKKLPIIPLSLYGESNGFVFERLVGSTQMESLDSILFIAGEGFDCSDSFEFLGGLRKYIVFSNSSHRSLFKAEEFDKVFSPEYSPHCDQYLVSLGFDPRKHDYKDHVNWPLKELSSDLKDYSSVYPNTADFWVHRVTAAIALDANGGNNLPAISLVIPAYNYGRFLGQCIRSILSQNVFSFEITVLDNCSTDNTSSVMEEFANDPRVRYVVNRANIGAGHNWRNGLWMVNGKYFSFFCADDYYNPGFLHKALNALENNPGCGVAYTSIRWVDESGEPVKQFRHPGYFARDYIGGRNEVADLLVHDCYVAPSATIYEFRRFCDTWRPLQTNGAGDWNMAIQMAEKFPDFIYINEPGVSYRWHAAQDSNRFYATLAPLQDHLSIVEGVFARGTQSLLLGKEVEVADHIERRLANYPAEINHEIGKRAKLLIEKLKNLKVDHQRPLFTVVLTTYNRPGLLKDALDSLERQVFKDFDVCLVNDAGEPVEHLLADFSFPIYYLRQGKNQGLSAARNAALRMAQGRYITYLDDDDFYLENHLQNLAAVFKERPDVVAYTGVEYVNEKIENGQRLEQSRTALFAHEAYDRDRLFVQNYIPVNTWAHSRECLQQVGVFDTTLTAFEDWDMLLRLAQDYDFVHIPEVSAEVRVRVNSGSSDHMLQRERKRFSTLYQKLYRRYPVLDNEEVAARRKQRLLELIEAENAPVIKPASMSQWLGERKFNDTHQALIAQRLSNSPSIFIAVVDLSGDSLKVQATLASLKDNYQGAVATVFTTDQSADFAVQTLVVKDVTLLQTLQAHFFSVPDGWFMLVQAGDEFTPSGLTIAALELGNVDQCRAIYADEMMRNAQAEPGLLMRPDLNLDLLLSFPAGIARHWLFNLAVWRQLGGFDQNLTQAFELDYILRLIEQQGFDGLGHISEPLLTADPLTLVDVPQEREVLVRHLAARGYPHASVESRRAGRYELNYGHSVQPMVSIIVAVQANMAWALRCLESLLEKTAYPHYEVLLLDQSQGDEAIATWLCGIKQMAVPQLQVFAGAATSYAEQCNQAVAQCRGDILLFLDSSAGIIDSDWLAQLLNHALRPEVGVVGVKLLNADGKVVHGGWHLGVNGVAAHAFAGEGVDAPGYLQRLQVDQNYAAVSGRCLMLRTALFVEAGGFAEDVSVATWLDIDLCLRLQQAGYLNVWTPRVHLLVGENATPAADPEPMYDRWLPLLARDPAYNLNASLIGTPFSLAPNELTWRPGPLLGLPTILAHMGDRHGCGHYRVIQPFRALKKAGLIDGALAGQLLDVVNLERYSPDAIVMQRLMTDDQHNAMRKMQRFSKAFKVYELDDYLPNLPLKNIHREQMPKGILKAIRTSLSYVDRFVVSTDALADAFKGMHQDIRVVQNALDPKWWRGLNSLKRTSAKPRVGWAGGISHTGDLALIVDVVKALAEEVEWVFFGMCPKEIQPYVHEFHSSVSIEQYPAKLASLNLDLAIAPVEQNLFNECKSNLRLLEYGVLGVPIVASDIGCYRQDGLPVSLVRNRFKDWVDAIRMHLADLDASAVQGQLLRATIERDWMLEGARVDQWYRAWLANT